jgi:AcrR family transcriptional regulator
MAGSLQARKQELVRNAIYDAAIEIFSTKGFDETTVEEVAQAAGVSRRSFFRYFASKDDLLALSVVNYGQGLVSAVAACPASLGPMEVIRETVVSCAKYAASQPRTRQTVEIAVKSASARQAYQSRLMEVEDALAEAFAARIKNASRDDLKARMYASVTLLVMNLTIGAWFRQEYDDISTSYRQVFTGLTRLFDEMASVAPGSEGSSNSQKKSQGSAKRRSRR